MHMHLGCSHSVWGWKLSEAHYPGRQCSLGLVLNQCLRRAGFVRVQVRVWVRGWVQPQARATAVAILVELGSVLG